MRRIFETGRRYALPLAACLFVAAAPVVVNSGFASAQTTAPEPAPGSTSTAAPNDHDINRRELNNFDDYLDKHPGVHRQLTQNPSLINDPQFLSQHPHLNNFLNHHPGVKEESGENPQQFMHRENQFLRRGGDVSRGEAARADRYFDQHPALARQLQKNPKLVDNPEFMENHPGFQKYLQNHPEIREDIKQNPYAFRRRERQYERHEGRERPVPPRPRR
ncbi:MAG: hypothetical protein KGM47_00435 [Acidobacteriota bacterium]|nr:hypothetical protein [Acidobacteriota bacterium]